MSTIYIITAITVFGTIIWSVRNRGYLPVPFRDRNCQGKEWRRQFPESSKNEIREFLALFGSAFAFRETERLKFGPDDSVMAVYRALYPRRWAPDALEVETLASDLCKNYGIELADVWTENDVSLGVLFAYVHKNKRMG